MDTFKPYQQPLPQTQPCWYLTSDFQKYEEYTYLRQPVTGILDTVTEKATLIPYISEFSAELRSINNRTHGSGFEEGKEVLHEEEGAAGSPPGRRGSHGESSRQRREPWGVLQAEEGAAPSMWCQKLEGEEALRTFK